VVDHYPLACGVGVGSMALARRRAVDRHAEALGPSTR
jgi:hypothetical protein